MSSGSSANIAVTIGNVSLGPGATAILGVNNVGSNTKTQEEAVKRCKNTLFVSEPRSVRAELINTKGGLTEGTCQWIRHNETYQSWFNTQESGVLWISGKPGRGKTMLSIFLTQEWESLPDCAVLYVFCGDTSTNDELTIMRSLLYQVLDHVPCMVNHVEDRLGTGERTKRTLSSRGDLWAMFTSILTDPKLGPVLGLIDGLDECHQDSTRWLLNNLRQVFDKESKSRLLPPNPFKLAIVSREMTGLRSYPRLNLETKTHVIEKDVTRVIDAKMKEHDLFSELDDQFIREVKTTLQDRSDGTFLWVGFAIQELLSVETKTEMRLVLDAIPRDLGALYSKILLRIKGPMKEKIIELLHWVTLACHALTASELADALDVDAQTILDLVAMSGSLLTLSEQKVWETTRWELPELPHSKIWDDTSIVVVKVVHASVSDFLKGDASEEVLPPPEFHIHVEEMELQITQRCLRELEIFLVQSDIPYEAFRLYATVFWLEHARRCGERLERLLDSDIAFVQSEHGRLIRPRWWNLYKQEFFAFYIYPESTGLSLLHVCSVFGLFPLAKRLLRDMALTGSQVDDPDSRGCTALCYALHRKHLAIAQLLVDHGASLTRDFEDFDELGLSESFMPIHMAMELGAEVAEPFLKKTLEGIGSSSRDTVLECSLFRKAAVLGNERLIHILCANGATLDSDIAGLALEDALLHQGSLTLINLFLQHGASTRNLDPTIILSYGLESVYDQVKTLLDYGMDPNSSNGGRPLLHCAIRFGPDLVELLLNGGAHLNALDYSGRPALFYALDDKQIGIAAMLLDRGADLTIKDSHGDTALHGAVKHRTREGVKLLLQHGLNVNIQNNDGETALNSALKYRDFPIAEILLKHGAYAIFGGSSPDAYGRAPVPTGSSLMAHEVYPWSSSPLGAGMHVEATSLPDDVQDKGIQDTWQLIQSYADLEVPHYQKVSEIPLRDAIMNRHVDMVRVLLEHGADPNARLVRLGTPLDWNRQFHDGQTVRIAELLRQRGGVYGERQKRPGTRLRHAFTPP